VALRFARDGRRVVEAGFREHENFLQNFLRLLGDAPLDVEVHFLEPVPGTPDARRRMAELSRERIALALEDKPTHDSRA
jgi:1-acyl-sn-glycerol-3-phosphate acyltransferase